VSDSGMMWCIKKGERIEWICESFDESTR
jgi:hypothetical protein